jgi:hypothetical protein
MVHAKDAADAAADDVAAGTLSAQAILESAFYRTNVQGEHRTLAYSARHSLRFSVLSTTTLQDWMLAVCCMNAHTSPQHPWVQLSANVALRLSVMLSSDPWPSPLMLHCAGSSTACVLVVNGTTLSASNLGDSGFVLVRDGVATFQCPQQQHNFNFPFQLGSADSMSDQPQAAMVS